MLEEMRRGPTFQVMLPGVKQMDCQPEMAPDWQLIIASTGSTLGSDLTGRTGRCGQPFGIIMNDTARTVS